MRIKNGPEQAITAKPIQHKDATFVRENGKVHIYGSEGADQMDVKKGKNPGQVEVTINGQKYHMSEKELAGATFHGRGGNDSLALGKGVSRDTVAWDPGKGRDTFSYDLPTSVPGGAGDKFVRKETRRTETSEN